jgi:molybdopterin molybdotransferase
VAFHRPVEPGENVRSPGEDLQPGQPLVAAGRRLAPADVALLAAPGSPGCGAAAPSVVVLSTGDELVPADHEPGPGPDPRRERADARRDGAAAGGVPFSAGSCRDDRKALMYALDTNLGHADLFVCTGGAARDPRPAARGDRRARRGHGPPRSR